MRDKIKLVSSAEMGTFYTTTKNLGESRPDA
jgi:ribosomal protein L33